MRQSVAVDALHVAQVLSQSTHLLMIASPNLFAGQVATHVFPSKNLAFEHFVHDYAVGPLHVKHDGSHILHNLFNASS